MNISQRNSLQMRGVAIIFVCLHNLFHIVYTKIKECEFSFYPERAEKALSFSSETPWNVFAHLCNYWGWYIVTTFIFLSGYGLVMKYEKKGKPLKWKNYCIRNYVKLMILMLIPWAICFRDLFQPTALLQLTYVINFIKPFYIVPGVFWYFSLAFQLYLLYLFFYHHRSNKWLLWASVPMILLMAVFSLMPASMLQIKVGHNFPYWLPVFLLGVWFARSGSDSSFMRMVEQHRFLAIIIFFLLWVAATLTRVLWALAPLLAILLLIAIFHEHKRQKELPKPLALVSKGFGNVFAWLGVLSPGIFVWHPVVRMYYAVAVDGSTADAYKTGNHVLVTIIYLAISFMIAAIYVPLYKKFVPKVMAWLKLDKA